MSVKRYDSDAGYMVYASDYDELRERVAWMLECDDLRTKLEKSEQRVKALEEALRAIADGRGMVPDKSTIYMNGRTPEVPAIFNKHDMQEIAKIVLEATCQSI